MSIFTTPASAAGLSLAPSESRIGSVGGLSAIVAASFTRPDNAVAYGSGDLIADATAAASIVPLALEIARVAGGTALLHGMALKSTDTGAAGAIMRVHLYREPPTCVAGDNEAWSGNTSEAGYLGSVDVTLGKAFSTGVVKGIVTAADGADLVMETTTPSSCVYALLEARTAFVPTASSVWTVSACVLRD